MIQKAQSSLGTGKLWLPVATVCCLILFQGVPAQAEDSADMDSGANTGTTDTAHHTDRQSGSDRLPGRDPGTGSDRGQRQDDINNVHRQVNGQYPAYQRQSPKEVPLGELQAGWISPIPSPGQSSPGVMHYEYDGRLTEDGTVPLDADSRVMRIRTRRHAMTTITLPNCENIRDVYVGDTKMMDIRHPRPNILTIYPKVTGKDTTLHVVSASAREYVFFVIAEDYNQKYVPDVTVQISFTDPDQCQGIRQASQRSDIKKIVDLADGRSMSGQNRPAIGNPGGSGANDYLDDPGIDFDRLDLHSRDFVIYVSNQEDADIAPLSIGTDGRTMLLDYGPKAARITWPSVFLREDGQESEVQSRVIGRSGSILQVMAYGELTIKLAGGYGSKKDRVVCIRFRRHEPMAAQIVFDPERGGSTE